MKRIYWIGLVLALFMVAVVAGGVGAAAFQQNTAVKADVARQGDIVFYPSYEAPHGISCADGGVLSAVVDESALPIGSRIELWCLPFHPPSTSSGGGVGSK